MRAGISVDFLGISQMSLQLTTEINKVNQLDKYVDVILFYHKYDKIIKSPHFAMLQEQELWGFDGPVAATSLSTANRLLACPKPMPKFFYVWDLEWNFAQYDADEIAEVYCHPNLHLIARSDEHAKIIEQCWKKPVAVIEDFNHEKLISTFEKVR